jgi:hypothetical protein
MEMQRKHLLLAGGVMLLVALAAGYTMAGLQSFAAYRAANPDFAAACGDDIVWSPPSSIYTGLYPNQPGLVTVRYRSQTRQVLRLSIEVPQLTEEQGIDVNAGPSFQEQRMKPALLGAALDALVGPQQRSGQILLRVQTATGATLCEASASVTLYSRQVMRWLDPVTGDNAPALAGWVTPQADVIRDLVGRAATWLEQHPQDYSETRALAGYDGGRASAANVRGQVDALFDTLQFVYHVHYTEDNVPYNRDATQLIQLPRDILTSPAPSGMCVETTVLLASAVERLGMRPYVVIVPGHAFLGVAVGTDAGAPLEYWETSDLNGGVTGSQANTHGDAEYSDAVGHNAVQRVLDIAAERAQGIKPIE